MSWEAVAAFASLLSVVVIAVSATFALRQVNQLRRATQLDGTMRIFAQFSDPDFIAARNFVLGELPERLKDPEFVMELKTYRNVDVSKHSIVKSWEVLEQVVRIQREATNNPYMWGGADFLYENAKRWLEANARERNIVSPRSGEPFHVDQLE